LVFHKVSGWVSSLREYWVRIDSLPEADWGWAARTWASPSWSLACLLYLFLALVMPPEGVGVRFCLFYHLFGVDCPGCGMTRGMSHFLRGNLVSSLGYHIFVPMTFSYIIFQSSFLFLGSKQRDFLIEKLNRHESILRLTWLLGLVAFFFYGALRIAHEVFLRIH